jgi:Zn-dependent protease with chaperone function
MAIFNAIDHRLVCLPHKAIITILKKYLQDAGCGVEVRDETAEIANVEAVMPNVAASDLLTGRPPFVQWTIEKRGEAESIITKFKMSSQYEGWYWATLSVLLLRVCQLLLARNPADALQLVITLFLAGLISCLGTNGKASRALMEGFYSRCKEISGQDETVVSTASHPRLKWMLLPWIGPILLGLLIGPIPASHTWADKGFLCLIFTLTVLVGFLLTLLCIGSQRENGARLIFLIQGVGGSIALWLGFLAFFLTCHTLIKLTSVHLPLNSKVRLLNLFSAAFVLVVLALWYVIIDISSERVRELKRYSFAAADSLQREAFRNSPRARWLNLWVYLFWVFGVGVLILCLLTTYNLLKLVIWPIGFERLIASDSPGTSLQIAWLIPQVRRIAYVCLTPPVLLVALIVRRHIKDFLARKRLARNLTNEESARVVPIIERLAGELRIKAPKIVVLISQDPDAYISHWLHLVITERLLQVGDYSNSQLEALLAHEMFHFKRDGRRMAILGLLSEWTFFGYGFLAVTQNSHQIEFEADKFAVRWCLQRGIDPAALGDVLRKIEHANAHKTSIAGRPSGITGLCVQPEAPPLQETGSVPWHRRLLANVRLFHDLYFSDRVASYFHPSPTERNARIRQIVSSPQ